VTRDLDGVSAADIAVAALCLSIMAFWTLRALGGENGDMTVAWLAGDLTWKNGRPDVLFSWTGTPLLAAIMAIDSRLMTIGTASVFVTVVNAVLTLGLVAALCRRLRRIVARPWLRVIAVGLVGFAPLLSTVWWKQINLIAFALCLAGFDLIRKAEPRTRTGAALIGLSVAFKPLLVLVPLVLALARSTRRAGLQAITWVVGLSMAGLAFAAWRAHKLSVLDPWHTIYNFAQKSNPNKFGYAYSPDNFGPTALLLRLGGTGNWRLYEAAVIVIAVLAGLWTRDALRGRSVTSWEAFAFVAVFSILISPIEWGHYGIVFTPLFVVLVVGMSREGGSIADWLGLAVAYVLASLVWRPYGTLTGNVHTFLSTGHLPPERANSGEAVGMEALSQGAQYVLLLTGILWYRRRTATHAVTPTADQRRPEAQAG
jgi:hypothetical protein